jgi:hypothetical protein
VHLGPSGVTATQLAILNFLARRSAMTMAEMSELMQRPPFGADAKTGFSRNVCALDQLLEALRPFRTISDHVHHMRIHAREGLRCG